MLRAVSSDFLVGPSAALVFWAAVVFLGLFVGGAITAAKGRWGWLLIVILTGGPLGCLTAFMAPAPDSLWARRITRTARAQH
jgi:hypothetical protein